MNVLANMLMDVLIDMLANADAGANSVSKSSCRLIEILTTGLDWADRQLDCSCQLPLNVTSSVASCRAYQV